MEVSVHVWFVWFLLQLVRIQFYPTTFKIIRLEIWHCHLSWKIIFSHDSGPTSSSVKVCLSITDQYLNLANISKSFYRVNKQTLPSTFWGFWGIYDVPSTPAHSPSDSTRSKDSKMVKHFCKSTWQKLNLKEQDFDKIR